MKFLWFLPPGATTNGSPGVPSVRVSPVSHQWTPPRLARVPDRVAQTVDQFGFHAVLTPTGGHCEDARLVTAALISATERLTFRVAFRPGAVLPVLSAQMVSTFGQLSGGRVLLNVVGGDNDEQCGYGDNLPKYERCARARESFGSPGRWATASRRR